MREIKFGDKGKDSKIEQYKDSKIEQYIGNKILGYEVMHGRLLRPARIKRVRYARELMELDSYFRLELLI